MELRPHRLPTDVLDRLAAGGGGAEAAEHLTAVQYSRHLLLIRGILDQAVRGSESAHRAYDLLADLAKQAPDAVAQVIRYPAVGAWARQTLSRLLRRSPDPVEPAQLGAIAAVAAIRAGVSACVEVPSSGGGIMLPSIGRLSLETDGTQLVKLRVDASGAIDLGESRTDLTQLHRLASADKAIDLVVDDLDPYRWVPADVIDGRLSADELRTWESCLDTAWRMLDEHHWTIAGELRSIVSVLTPIKGPERGQNSASARDTFGTIALSTPPDGRWLACTFAHEIQHAKLGAILDVVDLTLPDAREYYAPWRPDPRPLSGLLQGAYAYLGVAGFWRRQRLVDDDEWSHVEFAHWRASAFEVTETLLGSGRLTPEGDRFVSGMRRTLSAWMDEPVPAAAQVTAHHEAAGHRKAWNARNGRERVTGAAGRSPSRSAHP
ncbi:HEXXH motif domain-containing protein [Planotetraspora silvatica]|uniref:HEXXH motif domain-containing protein n=1 Tax=Planotetraspora silvatica TaxID=234614 RepID=A0A8J3URU7_9ACTN|nr:HEXXH motif domain-containing protein [Planotetraspora silvatica]GII48672.1 HEXXH motif domain-containing protein [Planotetraspora silvatica]